MAMHWEVVPKWRWPVILSMPRKRPHFGLPEINLGIIPGFGGTQRLARLIGANMARELIYTGKMIDAAEALRLGIVNKTCAPDQLMADVTEMPLPLRVKGAWRSERPSRPSTMG
jgi:enoyl-CoA hydratase/carnithine racemase